MRRTLGACRYFPRGQSEVRGARFSCCVNHRSFCGFADGGCVSRTSDSEWKTEGHFTIMDTMNSTATTPIEPFFENANQTILAKDTTMQMVLI
jgi:hypothetical protein